MNGVLHVPADHPYVRHVAPAPVLAVPSVWDLRALSRLGASIVHVHFGFEQLAQAELERWLDGLRSMGLRLVVTVHDLDNPHLLDQRPFHRLLHLLIERAEALTTLTPWAADRTERCHARRPMVIAHPHVLPLAELRRRHWARPRLERDGIYVHAATCRPNFDVALVLEAAELATSVGGVRLHLRAPLTKRARQVADRCAERPGILLDVAPRLSDRQLWSRLERARAVLLPYRWGTHSGLLEAAKDVGTPCLAPSSGGYADQGAIPISADGLQPAIRRAVDAADGCPLRERIAERARIVAAHRRIYDELMQEQ
ncbi:MAG: hypothetical protein ACRDZ2_00770 [Ilumatobacteraceae bacterium]